MAKLAEVFAKNLRYYRKLRGLRQRELAQKIGVHQVTAVRYESGTTFPDPENLTKIAEVLEIEETDLVYAGEPPKPIHIHPSLEEMAIHLAKAVKDLGKGKVPGGIRLIDKPDRDNDPEK